MSSVIGNTPFQMVLKVCIDYNQIRKIRKIPILPNAVDKMGPFRNFVLNTRTTAYEIHQLQEISK